MIAFIHSLQGNNKITKEKGKRNWKGAWERHKKNRRKENSCWCECEWMANVSRRETADML